MTRHLRRLRRLTVPGASFPYFLIAAVLVPVLFFGLAAQRDWATLGRDATLRVLVLRDTLADHALRILKTHQLIADVIGERVRGLSWPDLEADPALRDFLVRLHQDFAEIDSIILVDAAGRVRVASGNDVEANRDVSRQPWFRAMREKGADTLIGPRIGGTEPDGTSRFAFSHRLGESGDPFNGVVRIAVVASEFTRAFPAALQDDWAVAIVGHDHTVLARFPDDPTKPPAVSASAHLVEAMTRSDRGIYAVPATEDRQGRTVAFARVADFPVYVAFGFGDARLRANWYERLWANVLFLAPATLALIILAIYAWRSHRDLEETVELRTHALSAALAEKDQLLKEVHHRVKNNMQIVSSLIRMQDRVHTSPEETVRRVQAMALVHDLVYTQGAFASADLGAYARRLGDTLLPVAGSGIDIDYDLASITVPLDRAMPFALILSEVLTNALRHAFPQGRGTIRIHLTRQGGDVVLSVHDDGPGFNAEVDGRGFGLRLIRSLAVQLQAQVEFDHTHGTTFRMTFPAEVQDAVVSRA